MTTPSIYKRLGVRFSRIREENWTPISVWYTRNMDYYEPHFVPLSEDDLQLLSAEEVQWYRRALRRHEMLQSPLDMMEVLEPGTRRWPQLELTNQLLLALFEYRLTTAGPVSREDAPGIVWWYADQDGRVYEVPGPYDLPDTAQDYGGLAPNGLPIVFRIAISMRPRGGKSHIVVEHLPRWLLLHDPHVDVLMATYSDDFGSEWGGKFRDASIRYVEEGDDYLPYPKDGLRAPKELFQNREGQGTVRFVGVGGGVTGKPGTVLIADDLIKNDKEAQSEQVRKDTHDFYSSTWTTRKTRDYRPGARWPIPLEILMGTRWHADDPIGHFAYVSPDEGETSNAGVTDATGSGVPRPDWYVLNIPALSEGDGDPLGRPAGVGHPSAGGESATQLAAMRAADPRVFSALYQGSPSPKVGGTLSAELRTYAYHRGDLPNRDGDVLVWNDDFHGLLQADYRETIRFATIDPAATQKTSSDYTVIDVWAYSRAHGMLFLLHHYRDRIGTEAYIDTAIPLLTEYGVHTVITENITFGKVFGEGLAARGYAVEYAPHLADKVSKVTSSTLPGRLKTGRLRVPHGAAYVGTLQAEVALFPYGRHDDQVDSLAFAAWHVHTNIPSYVPPTDERPKPTTIGELVALKEEERLDREERRARRHSNGKRRWPVTHR